MPLINLVKIPIQTIHLSPGSHLLIDDVTWEQYEALLEDLGEDRHIPRINYCNGTLELMAPLPAHERPHRIMAYIVTAILDAQGRDWEDFGATTFKQPKRAGLEPDTCFYIQNSAVFPNLPITELIPQRVAQALATGTSPMLCSLRQQLQSGELPL
jgi:Uma2 family endonuclease